MRGGSARETLERKIQSEGTFIDTTLDVRHIAPAVKEIEISGGTIV
jgi:hypothetical protein